MPHDDTIYDLFLNNVILARQLRLPVRARPRLPPLLHRRCVLILKPSHHSRALERRAPPRGHEAHVIIAHSEVKRPHARTPALVAWRLHDAVDRRLVEPPREELERVARVEDERVGDVAHPAPAAVGGEDLQRGDGLRPEDGDGAEVGVAFEPDVGGFGFFFDGTWVTGCRAMSGEGRDDGRSVLTIS